MHRALRSSVAALAIAVASAAVLLIRPDAAFAKSLADYEWLEVRSANFTVYSATGEKKAAQLVRNLEYFREAVGLVSNLSSTDSYVPTRVYLIPNTQSIVELGMDANVAGFIQPTQRDYRIVVRDVKGMSETLIVLHEYAHFVIRNHNGLQYPPWFDEGFAEYLGSSRLRGQYFKVGLANEDRAYALSNGIWLPMRSILRIKGDYGDWTDRQIGMFYAQSWALVHYLQVEMADEIDFTAALARYLELADEDLPGDEAFEAAFGLDPDELNRALRRYLEGGRFGYLNIKADALLADFDYSVQPVAVEAVALGLADIAAGLDATENARALYDLAAQAPRSAGEARLRSALLSATDSLPALEEDFDSALALCPNNPFCQLDYARYLSRRANAEPERRAEWIARAREHYVKAWSLDDTIPEVYARYGKSFLTADIDVSKAVEMLEEAQYLLSSNLQIRYQLGRAYAAARRSEEAREALHSVVVWSHSDSRIARKAKALLTRLDELEQGPESTE